MPCIMCPSLGQWDIKTGQSRGTSLEPLVGGGDSVKPSQRRQLCAMTLTQARDSEAEQARAGGECSTPTYKARNHDAAHCSQGTTLTWMLGERSGCRKWLAKAGGSDLHTEGKGHSTPGSHVKGKSTRVRPESGSPESRLCSSYKIQETQTAGKMSGFHIAVDPETGKHKS